MIDDFANSISVSVIPLHILSSSKRISFNALPVFSVLTEVETSKSNECIKQSEVQPEMPKITDETTSIRNEKDEEKWSISSLEDMILGIKVEKEEEDIISLTLESMIKVALKE